MNRTVNIIKTSRGDIDPFHSMMNEGISTEKAEMIASCEATLDEAGLFDTMRLSTFYSRLEALQQNSNKFVF